MTKHWLTRLENIARQHVLRPCSLCDGEPWATLYRVEDWRSGVRTAAEWYLSEESGDRITDDLRCRRCGTQVPERHVTVLHLLKGAGWPLSNDPPGKTYRAIAPLHV